MLGSSEFADSGRFPSQKPARALEKSNFSQTCSLLSQYLKEKGTFGDLSLGMTCNLEATGMPETFPQTATSNITTTTMNLFPVIGKSGHISGASTRDPAALSRNPKSMKFFPQQAGFGSTVSKEEVSNSKEADFSVIKSEPGTAQMTIFYAGQVIVFNDFPADKAQEIMLLANEGSSQNPNTFAPSLVQKKPTESTNSMSSNSNVVPNFGNNLIQERVQRPPQPQPAGTDLPIARKASLARFLEKRKDRITAKAPYNTIDPTAAPSKSKAGESKSWLGLAAQSPLQYERQL